MTFLMLPVIIWSPKCEINKSKLIPYGWTDGQSTESQPRLLHCVNCNVILVSRIYCCENNHRVLAHHPGINQIFVDNDLKMPTPISFMAHNRLYNSTNRVYL